jgi:RimJ/RimL family protein N-acetyltransferase
VRVYKLYRGISYISISDVAEPRWWGRGFGTVRTTRDIVQQIVDWYLLCAPQEATQWIVNYAFEQLALHRISLTVSADHTPAVELYKRM